MNIIKELTEKYSRKYSEDLTENVNSHIGEYAYQAKGGIIEVDGAKISINLNEVGGATPVTEPFRITLHLDKTYETQLNVYPKDLWNEFLDFILPKRRAFIPKPILKQFWFGGDINLIKLIASDKTFTASIIDERIYIETMPNKLTDRIVLTPKYGIKNIDQFEKFVTVLKRIEYKIKNCKQYIAN